MVLPLTPVWVTYSRLPWAIPAKLRVPDGAGFPRLVLRCFRLAWRNQANLALVDALDNLATTAIVEHMSKLCHTDRSDPSACYFRVRVMWNPIERRLFSYISLNWASQPLRSLDKMLGYR